MSVSPDTAAVHDQVLQAGLTTRTDLLIKVGISSMFFHTHTYSNYIQTAETPRGTIKILHRGRFCFPNKAESL